MKIVTDCAADLSHEEIEALGITVAPLFIQFPNEEVNSSDLTADAFYDRLQAVEPAIPTTAQPSAGLLADLYRKLADGGESILAVHISEGLSGTLLAAKLANRMTPGIDVTTVDTMTLAGGERFQVLAATLAARAGWALPAILERLGRIRESTEVVYTLDTLKYLARGGRIGRVQALAGSVLRIKPIIHVDRADGRYSTVGKARTLPRAESMIVDHLAHQYGSEPLWVAVQHGKFLDHAEALSAAIKERLNVVKHEIIRISPILGVHTGPGIVGASVVPMKWMADLV